MQMVSRLNLNHVPFVSVDHMMRIVLETGIETVLAGIAEYIEEDFRRWELFDKTPRIASHSADGVIELMPTSDGEVYGFKYVNGHPKQHACGAADGHRVRRAGRCRHRLSGAAVGDDHPDGPAHRRDVGGGGAAISRPRARDTMAIIGNGAQSEFQALAFKALLGIDKLRLYDIDPVATDKCAANLAGKGFEIVRCASAQDAVEGAQIITTVTADKQYATILTDNMVGAGVHINAVGGDCPGKTELHRDILLRSEIFVEYPPQTRIEGEIQQLEPDHPVTELWEVIAGRAAGRTNARQVTLFDSVGFAIEDFSALRWLRDQLVRTGQFENLDMIADPDEPRDLYGMILRAGAKP